MDRIRRLPLPALLPIMFVVVGGAYFAIGFVTGHAGESIADRLVSALIYAAVLTIGFGVLIAVRRRKAGGADELSRMQRAFKAGTVPPAVDPAVWIPMFEKWRRQYRRNRWFGPVVFGLFTALGVWLAVTERPVWWLYVALFLGLVVWSVLATPRALRKIDAMLEDLRRRPITSAPADSAPGTPQPTAGAAWTLPGDEAPRPDDAS